MISLKCAFLNDYPQLGAERGLAFNDALNKADDRWNSLNVSGLERRLARLLGIKEFSRRNLDGNEGMHVIENILLRPIGEDDPFLPICVEPTCTDCSNDDPYSYRLTFVLPAYAGRFQNMDFRRFVEETIRLETPAHILPKICWLDKGQMATFEQAYRDWVSLDAGAPTSERKQKLEALNGELFQIKNVYPKQKLHDCGDDNQPPFILGRTQLGRSE